MQKINLRWRNGTGITNYVSRVEDFLGFIYLIELENGEYYVGRKQFGLKEAMDGLKTIGESTVAAVKQYSDLQTKSLEKLYSLSSSQSQPLDLQKRMESSIQELISTQTKVLTGALKGLEEQTKWMKKTLNSSDA